MVPSRKIPDKISPVSTATQLCVFLKSGYRVLNRPFIIMFSTPSSVPNLRLLVVVTLIYIYIVYIFHLNPQQKPYKLPDVLHQSPWFIISHFTSFHVFLSPSVAFPNGPAGSIPSTCNICVSSRARPPLEAKDMTLEEAPRS